MGRASLVDGFAMFTGDELYLENVHIPEYLNGTWNNHAPRRRRKLLLHRAELAKIAHKTRESGRTIVPLALYFKDGRAKVEIALATGKEGVRQAPRPSGAAGPARDGTSHERGPSEPVTTLRPRDQRSRQGP